MPLTWRRVEKSLHLFGSSGWRGQGLSLCGLHSFEKSLPMDDITLRVCKTCDRLGKGRKKAK